MPERPLEPTPLIVTPRPRSLPAAGRAGLAVVLGSGIAAFLAQWGAVELWFNPTQLTTIWLLGGVMLAIACLVEPRRWIAVLPAAGAGQALLFITMGLARPLDAIVLGCLSAITTATTAWVLRRVNGPLTFSTFREFLTYLAVVVVGGSLLDSATFLAGAQWLGYRPATFLVWRTFALSAVLAYLIVTPTLVLLVQQADEVRHDSTTRRIEAGALGTLLVVASGFVFRDLPHHAVSWPMFAAVIPPLMLWAGLRFTTLGVTASLLLVTVISTWGTAHGLGPFTTESSGDNTLSLQLFMLGIGLPLIGLAVILGEHRRTMAALRKTHGRLQEIHRDLLMAREEEGTRIARELHDDVGQRLALVSIGLSRLRRAIPDPESMPAGDIARLQEQTSSIARSLRQLSHQLHPAALEHVGLAPALQMTCDEVARVTGLEVRLASEGETTDLPQDVALCLFRVAQEALTNVVRHAGAHRVNLVLHRRDSAVSLMVSDDGHGFAAGTADRRTGLGLHSATERVGLMGGTLVIDSSQAAGTTIRVNLPLPGIVHA